MTKASISIVVPVHNEAVILREQVEGMLKDLAGLAHEYELLLVENGSTDDTPAICRELAASHRGVRVIELSEGDYGVALRRGIMDAHRDVIVIFNVEFWSIEFVDIALTALQTRHLVIGSKSAPGARDDRPFVRRFITRAYNRCLWILWGFSGTDTHGMKAFSRDAVLPLASRCVCQGFVFDTELVLRAERAGLRRLELPTDVREVRAPSGRSLLRRVPSVVSNLFRLWRALR